jgi:hypothetical protein
LTGEKLSSWSLSQHDGGSQQYLAVHAVETWYFLKWKDFVEQRGLVRGLAR